MSSIRILIFSFISEVILLYSVLCIYNLDNFCILSIKELCLSQLYIINLYCLNIIYFILFCIIILLDSLRLPFDYSECESELVAGVITEFSGVFFVLYSLSESNHIILDCLLICSIILGGLFLSFKLILIIIFIILFPRSILCRFKINDTIYFISLFLISFLSIFLILLLLIKIYILNL